ncbi:TPA: hypothetical protein ACH3X2_012680 [Trebouxia sp. C0005]
MLTTEVTSAKHTSMIGAPSICYQDPGAISEKEKENDQFGKQFAAKFVKKHLKTGLREDIPARSPLLGLFPTSQEVTGSRFGLQARNSPFLEKPDVLKQTSSPALLAPKGASTPIIEPYLKELSSSPASAQLSPLLSTKPRSVQDASGPFSGLRESASASPQGSAAGMHDVQVNIMSAQPAVPLRSTPGTRTLVKVRVRRALTLQTGLQGSICPKVQAPKRRNGCSRSVGDLNLSGACLQSAARANLSRSADWPASSPACIRKRAEEGTGYEVPRKTSKLEVQSQRWDFAADCLAQMSLQDKARHVRFGDTTAMAAAGHV